MVVETDDREERTDETESAPSVDSALIGWLSAIHSEVRAQRVEMREYREETRAEIRETRRELLERIESVGHRVERVEDRLGRLEDRVGALEQRMTRVEAGIDSERERKNRLIMWLGIGIGAVGALVGAGGVVVAVMGLLN